MPRETLRALPVARLRPARRARPDAARPRRSPRGPPVRAARRTSRRCSASTTPPTRRPTSARPLGGASGPGVHQGAGLAQARQVVVNPDRPFIADLDDLPLPLHHLLPLQKYLMPLINGPLLLHRDEPRLPGRLHVLHQARELRADDAPAVAGEAAGGDPGAARARRPAHPHVRGPVHGEPRAGRRLVPRHHRRRPRRSR